MKIHIVLFSDDEERLELEDTPGNRVLKIDEFPISQRDYQGIIHAGTETIEFCSGDIG